MQIGLDGIKSQHKGELNVTLGDGIEIQFADIALADEIRQMNEKVIECYYANDQFVFIRLRTDRSTPHNIKVVRGKLFKIFYIVIYQ